MTNVIETNSVPQIDLATIPQIDLAAMQLRRLLDLLEIIPSEPIQVKETKVNLRKYFGFDTYPGLNDNLPVNISSDANDAEVAIKCSEILQTIDEELDKGHFVHIRIVDEQQHGSGNPVIILGRNSGRISGEKYKRSPEDILDDKLVLDENYQLIGFKTNENEVKIKPGFNIDIFSQPVSIKAEPNNFDNKNIQSLEKVRLGGGFRLEFEKIDDKNSPRFIFKAVMVFDDNSPRRTALNLKKDWDIPRKEINISLELDTEKNKFIFPEDLSIDKNQLLEMIADKKEKVDIRDIGLIVLKNLVDQDGQAIVKWLQAVLYVNPKERIPSIEGVFSIKKNNGDLELMGPKIISWDGLETAKEWVNFDNGVDQKKYLKLTQFDSLYQKLLFLRLFETGLLDPFITSAQLNSLSEEHFQFNQNQNSLVSTVNMMLKEIPLDLEIKEIIANHIIPGYEQTFSRERTSSRLLGGLLNTLFQKMLVAEDQDLWKPIYKSQNNGAQCDAWQYETEDNKLILVSIDGFSLGFWLRNGQLIESKNMLELKEKSQKLSELFDVSIVSAVFGYLREGD